jgi:TfoX/Sxy family transcriptional regulator of competence genes
MKPPDGTRPGRGCRETFRAATAFGFKEPLAADGSPRRYTPRMATDASFADYVLGQVELPPGRVSLRKMFGEYALYVDDRVVALLCDDQLFLKPLEPLRARLGRVDEAAPYPGAKPHFRIADELERPAELTALLLEAARLLPVPKGKKRPATKPAAKQRPAKKRPATKRKAAVAKRAR